MDNIRKVFAHRLKERRGALTQEAYSAKLRIPLRTYQKFEAGVLPQKETMADLVRALGLKSETELFLDPDLVMAPPPHPDLHARWLRILAALAALDDHEIRRVQAPVEALLGALGNKPVQVSDKKRERG